MVDRKQQQAHDGNGKHNYRRGIFLVLASTPRVTTSIISLGMSGCQARPRIVWRPRTTTAPATAPIVTAVTPSTKGKHQGVAGRFTAPRHPELHAASVKPRASSAETSFQSTLIIPGKYLSRVSPLTRSSAASISAVNSPSARCRLVL